MIILFRGRMQTIKQIIRAVLNSIGFDIVRVNDYMNLIHYESSFRLLKILEYLGLKIEFLEVNKILNINKLSKSQLSQDILVLTLLEFKKDGFFVEFGATNGLDLSNTWLLEKEFGWKGILAEPSKNWHRDLFKNRSCHIEKRAIWRGSNEKLKFLESSDPKLSTIDVFRKSDSNLRKGHIYEVDTISLIDLLDKYNAPKIIDYLSIDTEGSELDILIDFDFEKYRFRLITIEHNFTKNREKIRKILISKGYEQVLESISSFDDWYILKK